jgi:hypothetical protein
LFVLNNHSSRVGKYAHQRWLRESLYWLSNIPPLSTTLLYYLQENLSLHNKLSALTNAHTQLSSNNYLEEVRIVCQFKNSFLFYLQENLSLRGNVPALTKKLDEAYAALCRSVQSQHFPLHKAAQEGKTVIVKALIYCGANKDERCKGMAPLHLAAQAGQTATVEVLIHLGADKEATIGMKNIRTFLQYYSHTL